MYKISDKSVEGWRYKSRRAEINVDGGRGGGKGIGDLWILKFTWTNMNNASLQWKINFLRSTRQLVFWYKISFLWLTIFRKIHSFWVIKCYIMKRTLNYGIYIILVYVCMYIARIKNLTSNYISRFRSRNINYEFISNIAENMNFDRLFNFKQLLLSNIPSKIL